jgi:hypothetical protein
VADLEVEHLITNLQKSEESPLIKINEIMKFTAQKNLPLTETHIQTHLDFFK